MSEITVFNWATFGIALGGVGLAIVSLGWQVVSWRYSGAIIKATTGRGFITFTDGALRSAALVNVRNVGRGPVQVTSWGFRMLDGKTIVIPSPRAGNRPLPHTLEGGHGETWHVFMEDLPQGKKLRVSAVVNLGNGKTVLGNWADYDADELARE